MNCNVMTAAGGSANEQIKRFSNSASPEMLPTGIDIRQATTSVMDGRPPRLGMMLHCDEG